MHCYAEGEICCRPQCRPSLTLDDFSYPLISSDEDILAVATLSQTFYL